MDPGGGERMTAAGINRDLLQAAVAVLPADDLSASRKAAASRFAALGFPTIGQEDWKYTNLTSAAEISNEWLESLAARAGNVDDEKFARSDSVATICREIEAQWILVHNGMVDAQSLTGAATYGKRGLEVARLGQEALDEAAGDDAMSAFNAALLRDGLHISVAANATFQKPIGILYTDHPSDAVTQTRIVIDAAANSHLRLIEYNLSAMPGKQFTNSVLQARLAGGATIDHVRIQNRDVAHIGVSKTSVHLARDANYRHNSFDLGGALTRNDVTAELAGKGASVSLNGLYLATGDQHIDNHTSILHQVGPTTSEEEYRGILSGKSQCVFNGKVIVSPGADGTDSRQSNHNLLLSDGAEIDTKPELEIYADDVKCAHGATVGQLDETALFYLRSRGLDIDEARKVITRAFAAGTLSALAVEECRDHLAAVLDDRLANLIGDKA
jgi:Fe-S cluster assembly protein SufD